ncbi:MAG TPA: VWA domain-containing protein [Bryobacteraceae bacterium]|jgi:VWFA-related protein|nr:VWA domain-containing protein [Bryobacteraceae bacterium]
MHKLITSTLFCGFLAAQTPQQTAPPQQQQPPVTTQQQQPPVTRQQPPAGAQQTAPQEPQGENPGDLTKFGVGVQAVQVPVWVYDKNGGYVDGLRPDQFRIFDNATEQRISGVDVAFTPISLVIVIQANADVEKMLPAVSRIGNLIQPHILGEQGEAAVIAYDSKVRHLQEFTHDADKITAAIKTIQPGSTSQHMDDAIFEASNMLRHRMVGRRRVILLIGEKRDYGSEIRSREVLVELQLANVTLYSANMSNLIAKLTAPPPDPRPPAIPATAMPMPGITAATPTTVMQVYGTQGNSADFLPLMIEIYRDAKGIFKANPVDVYTKGTGGEEFSYYRGRGLEKVVDDIGELLHAQYTITYYPSQAVLKEDGFHQIQVDVLSKVAHYVRVRPGYFLGSK